MKVLPLPQSAKPEVGGSANSKQESQAVKVEIESKIPHNTEGHTGSGDAFCLVRVHVGKESQTRLGGVCEETSVGSSSTILEAFEHNIRLLWSLIGTFIRTGLLVSFVLWLRWRMEIDGVSAPWRLNVFMAIQMTCWSLGAIECVRTSDLTLCTKVTASFTWFAVTLMSAYPLYYEMDMSLEKWNVTMISFAQMGPYFVGQVSMFMVVLFGQGKHVAEVCSIKLVLMLMWMGIAMGLFILNLEYYFIGGILMRDQPFYLETLYSGLLPIIQAGSSRVLFVHALALTVASFIRIHDMKHLEHFYIRNVKFCMKLPTVVTLALMKSWITFAMAISLSTGFEFLGMFVNYFVYVRTPESSTIGKRFFHGQSHEERKTVFVRYFSEEEYAEKIIVMTSIVVAFGFKIPPSTHEELVMVSLRSLILVLLEILEDVTKQKIVEKLAGISICKAFPVVGPFDMKESLGATLLLTAPTAMRLKGEVLASLL